MGCPLVGTNSRPKATGSRPPIRPLPNNPPSPACHWNPEKRLQRCATCVVIEHGCPLVEAPPVPRVNKAELLEVEMMAELVAEGAQAGSFVPFVAAYTAAARCSEKQRVMLTLMPSFTEFCAARSPSAVHGYLMYALGIYSSFSTCIIPLNSQSGLLGQEAGMNAPNSMLAFGLE